MKVHRVFVIADIHGCSRTFRALLFSRIRLEPDDTLYLLGDYIDRGPDSKGVLDTTLELLRNGYDVRPILGNHEEMLLQVIATGEKQDLWYWLDNGGGATLKSYGATSPLHIPETHRTFIEALPLYRTTDTHIFVHAGLNFSLSNPLSDEGRDFMLWERSTAAVPEKIGGRKLVTGHTIMDIDNIIGSLEKDLIQLDNGCFMGERFDGKGALIALELNSGALYVQKNIE